MKGADVVFVMGSASDWKHVQSGTEVLQDLGISFRIHVSSAHRTPGRTLDLIRRAEDDGCKVFICAAGMAAHLAGVVASHTLKPVLGVPLPGGVLDGVDALLSTVQMPAGIPVATFAVGSAGARNAAFFAAHMIAEQRVDVKKSLSLYRQETERKIAAAEREVNASIGRE